MDAVIQPTSPLDSLSLLTGFGVFTPISSILNVSPVAKNLIVSLVLISPSSTFKDIITPLYSS